MRGHCYDALVGLAGCDKSLPGMMMAMCRLNVPSVFIYGGSILPGTFRGKRRDRAGRVRGGRPCISVGKMSIDDLDELEQVACPSAGACGGAVHRQHHGHGLRGDRPGAALFGRRAGALRDPRPLLHGGRREGHGADRAQHPPARHRHPRRRWRTPRPSSPPPAARPTPALHLPAIAHECGIKFDLFDVAEIFKRTPYIADLKPGGRYVAKDMFEAGGIPLLMKTLLDHGFLHGDCMTVTGRTIAENLEQGAVEPGPGRRPPGEQADHADRRRGRPEGQPRARGRHREGRRHEEARSSPARRAASTARRSASRRSSARELQGRRGPRHPLRGPARRPRHARDAVDHGGALRPGHGRQGRADHRRALLRRHARLLHRPCRPGSGGRRPDRAAARRRHHRDRRRERARLDVELVRSEMAEARRRSGAARDRLPVRG